MAEDDAKSLSVLGFLTVHKHRQHGLFGGYLILNPGGRPLEFHCTTPVKPNRAQQILYGPTLKPYLYGEQIGQTLVDKAKHQPPLILTDCLPVLSLAAHVRVPVLYLATGESTAPSEDLDPEATGGLSADEPNLEPDQQSDSFHSDERLVSFHVAAHQLSIAEADGHRCDWLIEKLAPIAQRWDLAEPFQRIHEAINEAQRAA